MSMQVESAESAKPETVSPSHDGLGEPSGSHFRREAYAWGVRSAICAVPSAIWAATANYLDHVAEVLAIVTGVAVYALAFARMCSSHAAQATERRRRAVHALYRAVWLKAICVGVGVPAYAAMITVAESMAWLLAPWIALDLLPGAAVMGVADWVKSSIGIDISASANSYFGTLALTLLQGAFVALGLGLLTLAVLGVGGARPPPVEDA